MLSETFKEESNFVKWLEANDDVVKVEPFGLVKSVLLYISLVFKAEELNSSSKLYSSLN